MGFFKNLFAGRAAVLDREELCESSLKFGHHFAYVRPCMLTFVRPCMSQSVQPCMSTSVWPCMSTSVQPCMSTCLLVSNVYSFLFHTDG